MKEIELNQTVTCSINCNHGETGTMRNRLKQYPMLVQALLANAMLSGGYMASRERTRNGI